MAGERDLIAEEIRKYVSNLDRDIYTVSNIPEEVIAVIFAYVSRSPKSFRENIGVVIREEELGQERAAQFHEKWVLHYGHASVAEHATVHIGIERVSRLFSSLLELSSEYLSFTEYSQRYQKPKKENFYVPEELNLKPSLLNEYVELNNYLYDTYTTINDKLYDFLKREIPTPEGTDERTHVRALEKVAFEDARYALSLGTYTNLGVTGNSRAIEESLTKLLSSKYTEARKRADEIKKEVMFSVPTLVKYANESRYIRETRRELEYVSRSITNGESGGKSGIRLLDWTGKDAHNPEEVAVDKMIKAILFEHSDLRYEDIDKKTQSLNWESKLIILRKAIDKLSKYDNPINVYKLIRYEAEFIVSEACWHQLLRHRKVNWITQEPSVLNGITVPPNLRESGVEELLLEAVKRSERLYEKLMDENLTEVASYVVTNAHNRHVMGGFDLWELYHLINLRMSEGAQWDVKNIIRTLAEEIHKCHPNLVSPALRRVQGSS
jgi:thymidylate synthase ThyX